MITRYCLDNDVLEECYNCSFVPNVGDSVICHNVIFTVKSRILDANKNEILIKLEKKDEGKI